MINPTVQVSGRITDCYLISPKRSFIDTKFKVSVAPFDYGSIFELERQIDEFKLWKERERELNWNPDQAYLDIDQRKDSVFCDCHIQFETLHAPRLCKELKKFDRDEELMFKPVQVLGNLQMHKDGNVYVSPHQVILCPDPSEFNAFDDAADDEEGCWDFWKLGIRRRGPLV